MIKTLTFAALAALAAPAAMASGILVDDFTTAGDVLSNSGGNPATGAFGGVGDMSIIGNERYMWVSTDTEPSPNNGTGFEADAGLGQLNFTNGTNITGQAVLVYDGIGTGVSTETFVFNDLPPSFGGNTAEIPVNVMGLGGIDLVVGGSLASSAFNFDVLSFDAATLAGPAQLVFRAYAWDQDGNVATYDETLTNPFPANVPTFDTSLRLDEFTFGALFDWTDIGALAFSVESLSPEFDGALGAITVVPLPASSLLLLGGLGGLAGMSAAKRRRRRKA